MTLPQPTFGHGANVKIHVRRIKRKASKTPILWWCSLVGLVGSGALGTERKPVLQQDCSLSQINKRLIEIVVRTDQSSPRGDATLIECNATSERKLIKWLLTFTFM
jgi:hypothetical protein